MKNRALWFDSILVTVLVFALIGLIKFNPINFHVFDIKESWKDLELTDIYFSKVKSQDVRDTSVVIVDIDVMGREELAHVLTKIAEASPSVVAVDAYFLQPKSVLEDSLLKTAFHQLGDKLVLAGFFEQQKGNHDDHTPANEKWVQTNPFFGEFTVGHINLAGDHDHATVRYFRPLIEDRESITVQVVKKHNAAKAKEFLERGKPMEIINYIGGYDQFFHVTGNELLTGDNVFSLKNKIVLLGYAGEVSEKKSLEDAHFTPLNEELGGRSFPDTYGVVIHANIISMILRGDYISKVSGFWNFIIAVIVGLIHIAAYIYFYVQRNKWFHLFAKISQLITSIVLMFIVIGVLGAWNVKFDPALTLAVILLSVDVLYFYEPMAQYLKKKFGYHTFFSHHH